MAIDHPAFSRLGFGVTGPHAGLATSRSKTQQLIEEAIGQGVTFFDTGPAYGNGEAEKRLGDAVSGMRRNEVFLCTKAGIHAGKKRGFSAGEIEMSLRQSLVNLKTGSVDLLLLHGPSHEDLTDQLLHHLTALKNYGLMKHLGVCGRGGELDYAIETGAFDAIMAPINPNLDATSIARLKRAKASDMSVIGIEVMAGAKRPSSFPRTSSDLWYIARSAKQKLMQQKPASMEISPKDALEWAFKQEFTDSVVSLTTRSANLTSNAASAGLVSSAQIP
jgi:aryl-alcohol dehydrogenase-like predicted oxidoreductase